MFSFLLGSMHPYLVVPLWVLVSFCRLSLHWFTSGLFANSLPLCVLYFSATSRFHNESYVSHVSPLYRKVMKLLGEASPALINVMALYVYFFIEFHNCFQLAPFFVTVIFQISTFSDRWSFFQCAELSKCVYVYIVVVFFLSARCVMFFVHGHFIFVALSPFFCTRSSDVWRGNFLHNFLFFFFF
jgi:hypothetical protein